MKPKTAEHTQTPWGIFSKTSVVSKYHLSMANSPMFIADTIPGGEDTYGHEEAEANAAFIVRACNSHEELVNTIKDVIADLLIGSAEDGDPRVGMKAREIKLYDKCMAAVSKSKKAE